jgi:hypothetical protein
MGQDGQDRVEGLCVHALRVRLPHLVRAALGVKLGSKSC